MPYGYGEAQKDFQSKTSKGSSSRSYNPGAGGVVQHTPAPKSLGPNRNPDLMNKKEKKAYQKTTTVGKIHPVLNYTLAGTLINAATMKKTSTTTEHKGLRQDLRTGAYYHKAPIKRSQPTTRNGGATTIAKAASGGNDGSTAKLAGIDGATKLGFTHTNPAKTSFSESANVPFLGSPTKPKRA